MTDDLENELFDDAIGLALAYSTLADGIEVRDEVRRDLLARCVPPPLPEGFHVRSASDDNWMPHPVSGILMKILSVNPDHDYATLLLDVSPGTRFPAHHHSGPEECYVISGSLETCGRRLVAGDFIHADADTDHSELVSEQGCRVLLVVPLDELGDRARRPR
jgi:quercetin dioxygenase-like cupin family protein